MGKDCGIKMNAIIKKYLSKLYKETEDFKDENTILAVKEHGPFNTLLDVGCWKGEKTILYSKAGEVKKILGIEPIDQAAKSAEEKKIKVFKAYADSEKWPIEDNSVDVVVSSEVIEHLVNVDFYFQEAHRVLKKGGIMINTTNNLASFHNIFSLLFGFAPFDLTNSSRKVWSIGNPFSLHNRQPLSERGETWLHKCVYTPKWLSQWQGLYGFETVKIYGAGFYPFPAFIGNIFKNHCAFFTLVGKKK